MTDGNPIEIQEDEDFSELEGAWRKRFEVTKRRFHSGGRGHTVTGDTCDTSKEIYGEATLTEKSHEFHMWITCVVIVSHVHFTCERNVKR